MLAPGGSIFHQSALTGFFGRGYYSFQPRLFTDFYPQNGFEVLWLGYRLRPNARGLRYAALDRLGKLDWRTIANKRPFEEAAPAFGASTVPNNAIVGCLARNVHAVPFTVPQL